MKHYGLDIAEGSEVTNLTAATGTSDPANPNAGELFFRTDQNKLRVYNGTGWDEIAGSTNSRQIKSAAFTAASTNNYINLLGTVAFTLTLPASPSVGDWVGVKVDENASTNNLTIGRNSSNISGLAEDLVVDVDNVEMTLVYVSVSQGWIF